MAAPTNGSNTATLAPTYTTTTEGGFSSHMMSSSISSLSSSNSARPTPSHVSKTYRQSSSLFLTRRLPEALSTILPLITPHSASADGVTEPAPVAKSSRNTRIKVWTLYIAILNAVAALEPDEGKAAFGTQEWRSLCSRVRDGDVWEEVVQSGYHGVEGDVDSDVVINLCALVSSSSLVLLLTDMIIKGNSSLDACKDTNVQPEAARDLPCRIDDTKFGSYKPLPSRTVTARLITAQVLIQGAKWGRHAAGSECQGKDPGALYSPCTHTQQ